MTGRLPRLPQRRSSLSGLEPDGVALRRLVQQFIRGMGLLATDRTPCGKPLAVSHAHALMVLREHRREGRVASQRELGPALGIDKSNVARLALRMEKAGHLTQERDRRDGRVRLLMLTRAGATLAEAVERASRARFESLFRSLPRPQRSRVLSALEILNRAVMASSLPVAATSRGGTSGPSPTRAPMERRVGT